MRPSFSRAHRHQSGPAGGTETPAACWVENDVNAASLGEYWLGNGRGAKSLFCITIGTGIGGAFVLDGKLWPGHSCTAGEVGQAKLGGRLHWEDAASVTALVQKAARLKGVEPETQREDPL